MWHRKIQMKVFATNWYSATNTRTLVLVQRVLPEIAARGCDELWLNPGTESEQVLAEAQQLGLNVIQACSILGVGDSPDEL